MDLNQRNPRIDASRFSMVPRTDIPRSTFVTQHAHKTTIDASYLVPLLFKEVLPGDVIKGQVTIFARLATLLFPLMDRLILETFFFFVPNRLVWTNWVKLMGERKNPSDSIDYTIPQYVSAAGGFAVSSLFDYFGLPTVGQVDAGATISVNTLPFRAYCLIWDEWFRDENLQNNTTTGLGWSTGDGPDTAVPYGLLRRNKRPDYFTSALPWPLKGGVDVTLPLAGQAPVTGIGQWTGGAPTAGTPVNSLQTYGGLATGWSGYWAASANTSIRASTGAAGAQPEIYADLSQATGATINALRLAFQTQRLLERDARSGTRYTELLRAHFGVTPEDQRLQRPEYIGGGRGDFNTQAIPQTSATGLTGSTTPLGGLGAASTATDQHSFSYHATEHGMILGLINVRSDLSYQQGLHKKWTRSTRYDYYWPVFAHLGEQAVQNREIYAQGDANDTLTFGYQERWSEYRYEPSIITGLFRSTSASNIDEWHLAEQFASLPALNNTFIQDSTRETLARVLAAGLQAGQQILLDTLFRISATRPMPTYSVPGMVDRF